MYDTSHVSGYNSQICPKQPIHESIMVSLKRRWTFMFHSRKRNNFPRQQISTIITSSKYTVFVICWQCLLWTIHPCLMTIWISQQFLFRWLSTVETTTPETWCTWQPYNAHLMVRRKNISQMEKRCANIYIYNIIFEKQMQMTPVLVGGKRLCFGLGWPSKIEVIGAPGICTIYSICIRKTLEYAFRFLNFLMYLGQTNLQFS